MKALTVLILIFLPISAFAEVCDGEPIARSEDNFKITATIYIVCPKISTLSNTEAKNLLQGLIKKYHDIAPQEIFIQFLATDKFVGFMEEKSVDLPKFELVADYFNATGRLFFWPGTDKQYFIEIHQSHHEH